MEKSAQDASTEPPAEPRPQADGDFRGPYGYGRRAYSPDPVASYGFEPGPARTLPHLPKNRWRVPG